ncbi:hypothetical protein DSM106972_095350 [Dulcicalothrix desertica PCC 7102]|uniref:Uncharacterized protein n=1 Tax=Dulcicalothrix desertica PCC 7102 TaxID=232991 RepID=A0A3S1C1W2_9CYAN|nr:hypothetical protein [Dulcicalothrix desertica]RUS93776.1 hypothetical protein DSM106972_095350 [Dulcicalothrix desertica PCC 7102]TWH62745.1 hypothetical protein CAL7102_00263 [Dulcicalothrix desertica PCC 7102]
MPVKINNPLMQYHPIRFYEVRKDFIAQPINILLSGLKGNVNHVFSISDEINKEACLSYMNAYIRQILLSVSPQPYPRHVRKIYRSNQNYYLNQDELGVEWTTELLNLMNDNEYRAFQQYASLTNYGSNIFDFSCILLDLFAETDIGNVLLKDICLPFQTIYLHFGKQENKKINGSMNSIIQTLKRVETSTSTEDIHFLLDGAYITQCPKSGTLRVTLTSVKNKHSKYCNNCIDCSEEVLAFILPANNLNTTVSEAVSWQREILLKSNQTELHQTIVNKIVDEIVNNLNLVINCALYLQSYPDDIEEDYTESAPRNLVQQTKRAPGAEKAAQKKLNQLGYRKIKFCGRKRQQFWQLEDEDVSERVLVGAASGEPKRNMAPHKRRAHIRKQRYGKELQSWKYVWIKETTIHKEKYEPGKALQQYRIYEVAD